MCILHQRYKNKFMYFTQESLNITFSLAITLTPFTFKRFALN